MDLFGPFTAGLFGVLLFGCFVQVITILSMVRYGLGLSGYDVGIVTFILALVLSLLMIEAKFGLADSLEKTIEAKPIAFNAVLDSKIRPFLIEASDPAISQRVAVVTQAISAPASNQAPTTTLAQLETAFLLSQLKRALSIGLILLIPLLVIDLMVAVTFSVVGVQSISALTVSIPLKILLFVIIDGWNLIVNKLLEGFI